jgi:hypothetical protein
LVGFEISEAFIAIQSISYSAPCPELSRQALMPDGNCRVVCSIAGNDPLAKTRANYVLPFYESFRSGIAHRQDIPLVVTE